MVMKNSQQRTTSQLAQIKTMWQPGREMREIKRQPLRTWESPRAQPHMRIIH